MDGSQISMDGFCAMLSNSTSGTLLSHTLILWRCGVGQGARVLPEPHTCRENGLLVVLLYVLDCNSCAEVEA